MSEHITAEEDLHEPEQHKVTLSDDAWASILTRAALEDTTASALCERLLAHYLSLEERPRYEVPDDGRYQRTVYIDKRIWAKMLGQRVREKRSISEILEQLIRAYTGLPLG